MQAWQFRIDRGGTFTDVSAEPIGATAGFSVEDGDRLSLLTPGGGGFGMQP